MMTTVEESVINLRKNVILGGVYELAMFMQPPQPNVTVSYDTVMTVRTYTIFVYQLMHTQFIYKYSKTRATTGMSNYQINLMVVTAYYDSSGTTKMVEKRGFRRNHSQAAGEIDVADRRAEIVVEAQRLEERFEQEVRH